MRQTQDWTPIHTYLAVMIHLFSRRVVGWSLQRRQTTDVVLQALLMAVSGRLGTGEALAAARSSKGASPPGPEPIRRCQSARDYQLRISHLTCRPAYVKFDRVHQDRRPNRLFCEGSRAAEPFIEGLVERRDVPSQSGIAAHLVRLGRRISGSRALKAFVQPEPLQFG